MNSARYLTFFGFLLANIEHSHLGATALLKNGASSFALSLIPGNSCGVDKTIEKTFMRLAKSRDGSGAGLVGLTQNYGAYQRWVRTTHERVKYLQRTLDMVDMVQARKELFYPTKQNKLKTMSHSSKKVKLKSARNKVIELKHQGIIAFQLLIKSQEGKLNIPLMELIAYQLTPVLYSLGTEDVFFN